MNPTVKVTIKNIRGQYRPMNLFKFFDDGIRKRLPKNVAKEFHSTILSNIDTNRFGFQLSENWVNYKKSIGADTRPFIMFKHYKNGISIVTEDGHLSVGFKKTTMHPRAKISLGKLAVKLEYGDLAKGIPARPLWRRTAETFFKEKRAGVGELIKKSLK